MSAETQRALDDAVRNHWADERGGDSIMTAWIMHAEGVPGDGDESRSTYVMEHSSGTSVATAVGLARMYEARCLGGITEGD